MRIQAILLLTAGLVLPSFTVAQRAPVKFGDLSPADFATASGAPDSAHAVVLVDFGESRIDYESSDGFYLMFERTRRIRILKKDGYEWGNLTIALFREGSVKESLMGLKAVTYNMEGGQVVETKLKNDAVFEEDADQNLRLVKIAMPNVKVGSIIEFNYKIKSPFIYNFQDWTFQSRIPVRWSEYRTHIPHFFGFTKMMQGYLDLHIDEHSREQKAFNHKSFENDAGVGGSNGVNIQQQRVDYTDNIDRWVVKDAPAFIEERFMTTTEDYVAKVNFELSSIQMPGQFLKTFNDSWEKLNNNYLKDPAFGGVISGSGFLDEYVKEATEATEDEAGRVQAVYSKVRGMLLWDGQRRKFSEQNLKKVVESKKGSSAEINLMLVNMLRRAGLKANPVLLSTRDHGFVRTESPVSSQFNYVIAAVTVKEKIVLLDATERSLPIHVLPERCLNGDGFMVSEEGYQWIDITPVRSRSGASGQLTLSEAGLLTGKVQLSNDGYFGQERRLKYAKHGEDKYVEDLSKEHGWVVSSRGVENIEKVQEPVKELYDVEFHQTAQKSGDRIYLNPVIVERVERNPFTLETRKYPVDFASPREWIVMMRISIPTGWEIEELPQPRAIVMSGNGAKFSYSLSQSAGTILLTSQLMINKTQFSQEEYPQLREFYAQVVSKHAESIVLKQK